MQQAKTPRYQLDIFESGFRVSGRDRCPVEVTLEKTHFRMVSGDQTDRIGLFNYRELNRRIAKSVMQGWKSPRAVADPSYQPRWITQSTEKALNARLHPVWRELVSRADPAVQAVQRKVFAATCSSSWFILADERLYRDPYLVSDIQRFPAAAIATAAVGWMSLNVPWILERYPYAAETRRERGRDAGTFKPTLDDVEFYIRLLQNWRALFSPTGQTYTSLDKTLMNLPGRMTAGILANLHRVTLERPVYDRLELMTICAAAECRRRHHDKVYAHARRDDILRAMKIASTSPVSITWPSTRKIVDFTRDLSDFPDIHHGGIVGLARKSVEWHREGQRNRNRIQLESLGLTTATKAPPIPLPAQGDIRFLSTVEDIRSEGDAMRHCVASYARDAIQGHCFLFHVDHGGEQATVEVDRFGRVIQSRGPGNEHNTAASWGQQVLKEWGQSFPLPTPDEVAAAANDRDAPF